jgi:hypothetical protein
LLLFCTICGAALVDAISIMVIGPALGGDSSVAGINASGQVAGFTLNGTGLSSVDSVFFYSAGLTNLGMMGGRSARHRIRQ